MYVSGASEVLRLRIRIGQMTQSGRTVVSRNSGGASFEFVNGDGERCAEHRGVVIHLMRQIEFAAARNGQRCAQLSAGIRHHEVDTLCRGFFGSHDEVAFVFAILVVDHNDEFALTEVLYGFLYCVESDLFHIIDNRWLSIGVR